MRARAVFLGVCQRTFALNAMTPILPISACLGRSRGFVRATIEANNAQANAKGRGNRALRRQGIAPRDYAPHDQGMNRAELAAWWNGAR